MVSAARRQDYDYLIKLLLIGDSGKSQMGCRIRGSAHSTVTAEPNFSELSSAPDQCDNTCMPSRRGKELFAVEIFRRLFHF